MIKSNVILIVTLGTRDLQLDFNIKSDPLFRIYNELNRTALLELKNHPDDSDIIIQTETTLSDVYTFIEPRQAAAIISSYYDYFESFLRFPMIHKAMDWLSQQNIIPEEIWWVCTNQQRNDDNKKHWNRDTIGYTQILEKCIKKYYTQKTLPTPTFYSLIFEANVTQLDYNYVHAGTLLSGQGSFQNIAHGNQPLYLLNQGGIDAINTAMLLKLTEYRPDTIQLQVNEDDLACRSVHFPKLLSQNFQNRIILQLVNNYRFDTISLMAENVIIQQVAYAVLQILSYNWDYFVNDPKFIELKTMVSPVKGGKKMIQALEAARSETQRIQTLIVVSYWYYQQGMIAEVIIRLNTLKEKMLQQVAKFVLPELTSHMFTHAGETQFQKLLEKKPEINQWIIKSDNRLKPPLKLSVQVLLKIAQYAAQQDAGYAKEALKLWGICQQLSNITHQRNEIIHFAKGATLAHVNQRLSQYHKQTELEQVFHNLKGHYKVKGMGFMETSAEFIAQLSNPDNHH
jgi:hypothetical protein